MHWAFRISIICSDIFGGLFGAVLPQGLGAMLSYPVDYQTCFFDFRRRDNEV
jgi:hypothetical protein